MPIISIVGPSDSGKTRLIEQVVRALTRKGYRVGVLKHTHARIKIDRRGTDTDRFRRAGAAVSAIADDGMLARFQNTGVPAETLAGLASELDLLLVEGYKAMTLPKILLTNSITELRLEGVIATVGRRAPAQTGKQRRHFKPGQAKALASWLERDFIVRKTGRPKLEARIDGQVLPMKPFVQQIMAEAIRGMLASLKGGRGRTALLSIDFGKII